VNHGKAGARHVAAFLGISHDQPSSRVADFGYMASGESKTCLIEFERLSAQPLSTWTSYERGLLRRSRARRSKKTIAPTEARAPELAEPNSEGVRGKPDSPSLRTAVLYDVEADVVYFGEAHSEIISEHRLERRSQRNFIFGEIIDGEAVRIFFDASDKMPPDRLQALELCVAKEFKNR
jgi:hypothetical protein